MKTSIRWRIGILMFLGIVINYMDRVNISHAIVLISEEMQLTPVQQGVIMSAFSWGYVFFMMIGGWLVDKFGPRMVNALSCLAWSVFTGMGALVSGYFPFLISRLLLGAGEAPIFPGNASVVKRWFPLEERGKATALFDVGSYVGAALVAPIIIYLMTKIGWRFSFLLFSVAGIAWSIVWFYYYKDPSQHPKVSTEEKVHIRINDCQGMDSSYQKVTTFHLLRYKKIWGMSLGFFLLQLFEKFFPHLVS